MFSGVGVENSGYAGEEVAGGAGGCGVGGLEYGVEQGSGEGDGVEVWARGDEDAAGEDLEDGGGEEGDADPFEEEGGGEECAERVFGGGGGGLVGEGCVADGVGV